MEPNVATHLPQISAAAGIGLSIAGLGIGVGLIFNAAINAIARQPEKAKELQALMFIGMAVVEGPALFGVVVCFLTMIKS